MDPNDLHRRGAIEFLRFHGGFKRDQHLLRLEARILCKTHQEIMVPYGNPTKNYEQSPCYDRVNQLWMNWPIYMLQTVSHYEGVCMHIYIYTHYMKLNI